MNNNFNKQVKSQKVLLKEILDNVFLLEWQSIEVLYRVLDNLQRSL